MGADVQPEGMSLRQAARFLRRDRATVAALIAAGLLPARRLGKRNWTILRADSERLVRGGGEPK